MYDPQGLALEIFQKRYTLHPNETWLEACIRVANHVSEAENGANVIKYRSEFLDILQENLFSPGGRIWYGSGRPKGQLLNCFSVPCEDSREGWGRSVSDMIVIAGTGGGAGFNFSPIRPRGSIIAGTGGIATGAVSLMEIINMAGEVIKAGGGRRTALMFALNLDHGDLPEFLDKKLDLKQLNNANVSVWFNENPEEFFKKVKKDEQIELKFRGKTVKTVPAKQLWQKIIQNSLKTGEPGILNGYLANKMWNGYYWKPITITNPCGEIPMVNYGACCLGSLVLPRFVRGEGREADIDWDLLKATIGTAVRFLDNVLSVNNYPLPEIADTCSNIRQIGLGLMGLHDTLLMMGLRYNSDTGLEFVDKLMSFIKNAAYNASIDLAIEKGAFPKFEADAYLKSGFIKTLKPSIRTRIKENGIRNCSLLTIAPTGTTSMMCEVSSGIEPMFAPAYLRRFRDGDELKEEVVVHPLLKKFIEEKRGIKHFQGSYELSLRDHLEMQRVCQKHVDNACSKTINVKDLTEEELSDVIIEFLPELKGLTIYPDGSRENQPLTPMPLDEAIEYIKEGKATKTEATSKDTCKSGSCDI
jgi:ribonucleoside-diphosphate reductase, adenosylcobalamin-dependent